MEILRAPPKYAKFSHFNVWYKVRAVHVIVNSMRDDLEMLLLEGTPELRDTKYMKAFTYTPRLSHWSDWDARPGVSNEGRAKSLLREYGHIDWTDVSERIDACGNGVYVRLYVETDLHSSERDPYVDGDLEEADAAHAVFRKKSSFYGTVFTVDPAVDLHGAVRARNAYGFFCHLIERGHPSPVRSARATRVIHSVVASPSPGPTSPKKNDCPICMETIDSATAYWTTCKHAFHKECIESWMKRSSTCPLCRTRIMSAPSPVQQPAGPSYDYEESDTSDSDTSDSSDSDSDSSDSDLEDLMGHREEVVHRVAHRPVRQQSWWDWLWRGPV